MDVFDHSDPESIRLVATGPRLDPSECNGAFVSNGRISTTGQGSGVQVGQVYGREASPQYELVSVNSLGEYSNASIAPATASSSFARTRTCGA